jgi:hypothetical protein
MFLLTEVQMPLYIPMRQGACRDHFRVQARTRCKQTMKKTAMTIRDIDHGGDVEPPTTGILPRFQVFFNCGHVHL